MSPRRGRPGDELVHVSALNQFLYCPRRYWYYRFYPPRDHSAPHERGQREHDTSVSQPGAVRERYFSAPSAGLHGRVDLIEAETTCVKGLQTADGPAPDENHEHEPAYIPVERKRGSQYYWNDEVQVAGYVRLLNAAQDQAVDHGIIYLRGPDTRHEITVTADHREAVDEAVAAIQSLDPGTPPPLVENANKCRGCSVRHYCLPRLTAATDPAQARNSSWGEVLEREQ